MCNLHQWCIFLIGTAILEVILNFYNCYFILFSSMNEQYLTFLLYIFQTCCKTIQIWMVFKIITSYALLKILSIWFENLN